MLSEKLPKNEKNVQTLNLEFFNKNLRALKFSICLPLMEFSFLMFLILDYTVLTF